MTAFLTEIECRDQAWNAMACIVVDAGGTILIATRAAEIMFGYDSPGELCQRPIDCLVPEAARALHPDLRAAYFANPSIRPMGQGRQLQGLRKDGTLFDALVILHNFYVRGVQYVMAQVVRVMVET